MAICPNCKEQIEILNYSKSSYDSGEFLIDEKGFGNPIWDRDLNSDLIEPELSFSCPECNEDLELFDDEEAEKFLKEKDELQEIVVEKLKKIENERNNKN